MSFGKKPLPPQAEAKTKRKSTKPAKTERGVLEGVSDSYRTALLQKARLYTPAQMFVAAIFGGMIIGFGMAARNSKAIGDHGMVLILPWISRFLAFFTLIVSLVIFYFSYDPYAVTGHSRLIWPFFLICLYVCLQRLFIVLIFNKRINAAFQEGARRASNWSVFYLCFIANLFGTFVSLLIILVGHNPELYPLIFLAQFLYLRYFRRWLFRYY
ncbi:MAG: hypothetical protein GC185_06420 [Alphaproteobacteria bacterium]|nr:hypothetical protein [Alphaproteobacteria bacterium]